MSRSSFFVITFMSFDTGRIECSRTFSTIRAARKAAKRFERFGTNVRIMQGGPGGMEVV